MSLSGFAQSEINQVDDLYAQWAALTGYRVKVPDSYLAELAKVGVSDLRSFGRYVWDDIMNSEQHEQVPWGAFGMSHEQWVTTTAAYATKWKDLTGKDFDLSSHGTEDFNRMFASLKKGETAAEFQSALQQNPDFLKQYGWVRYGLNYNDFQLQKESMGQKFGMTLTNDQAVTNLLYWHTFSGQDRTAHAAKQQQTGDPSLVAQTTVR